MPLSSPSAEPIHRKQQLLELFEHAEKPAAEWRIGVESEKFGVHTQTGNPLGYAGEFGVLAIYDWLIEHRGYVPESELPGGPVIAVRKGGISLTLEPGAQFELSAPAVSDAHQVEGLLNAHLEELAPISARLNLTWMSLGFHPLARLAELPWVPKQRYAIMREYLPTRGSGALDMMQRTATVQGNFDYSDQKDALKKLLVGLRMAPLVNAWVANSPYVEGVFSGKLSARGDVWLRMEPERSGLIDRLWSLTEPGYDDYVEWALEAPMFLVKRSGRIIDNSGQPFRDFLEHGFQGERATQHDWVLHVNSLFPEARLKNTLELRSVDSLPPRLASAVMTLFTGLLYDATSLNDASELLQQVSLAEVQACRAELLTRGLATSYGSWEGFSIARQLLELARAGLQRRGRRWQGHDESGLLDPLAELLEARTTPAQRLLERLGWQPEPARLAALCCDSRPA